MVGIFISGFTFNIIKIHKAPLKGYLQMIPTLESNLNHGELKSKRREKKIFRRDILKVKTFPDIR